MVLILAAITYTAQHRAGALGVTELLSFKLRLANAIVSYVSYIGKIFLPINLAVLYPHPGHGLEMWKPILCFVLLVVISILVVRFTTSRRRYLMVGWLWYLGTLVPVIGLIQTGAYAMGDRFVYLPSIGISFMVVWTALEISAKWRSNAYKYNI